MSVILVVVGKDSRAEGFEIGLGERAEGIEGISEEGGTAEGRGKGQKGV